MTGTVRYASTNAHKGYELSRRDDVMALGFVMIYFFKGKLPWMNVYANSKEERYQLIKEIKLTTSPEELCQGCPIGMQHFIRHSKDLRFEQKPNYKLLRSYLKDCAV